MTSKFALILLLARAFKPWPKFGKFFTPPLSSTYNLLH